MWSSEERPACFTNSLPDTSTQHPDLWLDYMKWISGHVIQPKQVVLEWIFALTYMAIFQRNVLWEQKNIIHVLIYNFPFNF